VLRTPPLCDSEAVSGVSEIVDLDKVALALSEDIPVPLFIISTLSSMR